MLCQKLLWRGWARGVFGTAYLASLAVQILKTDENMRIAVTPTDWCGHVGAECFPWCVVGTLVCMCGIEDSVYICHWVSEECTMCPMLIPETWSPQKPNDFLLTVDTEQPIYDGINNCGRGWWARTNAPIMKPFMRWLWKEISQLNWELVPTVGHTRPAQLKRKWFPSGLWYSLIGHKHFSQAEPFSPGGAAWIILHLLCSFLSRLLVKDKHRRITDLCCDNLIISGSWRLKWPACKMSRLVYVVYNLLYCRAYFCFILLLFLIIILIIIIIHLFLLNQYENIVCF